MQSESKRIKNKIIQELTYIGYDISLIGTQYLAEIIFIIYNKSMIETLNLEKNVYPILAKQYNKKTNNIRCNINYATDIMYNRSNTKFLMKYFNFYINIKPSIKQVIYTVLNKIE